MSQALQYYTICGLILANVGIGAMFFGWMGWKASKAGYPLTTLASYIAMFFYAGIGGIGYQLMIG